MIISSIALTFFAPILFSKAEKIKTRIEFESYRTQINNILILYVIISFTSLGTVLISQNVILGIMLNAKYISNGYLFILISLGWLLYQIAQVHATLYLYTTSDSRAALISSIISGIFYLLLLILLVKSHNEIGAALAFIISNILRILFQIILSKRAWYNFKLRVMDVNITSLNN
jgi:O-antigen/teichoic acid export membrane protein